MVTAPPTVVRTSPAVRPLHLGFLDGARALAALYVVWHHIVLQMWPVYLNRWPSGTTLLATGWLLFGHFAVSLFIVISGYCLMLPVARGDGTLRGGAWQFFKRRARRILPPYYLAMLLSLIAIRTLIGQESGTHWDISVPVARAHILACLAMLQDIFTTGQINHAFWSIAVEWKIYFFFPLLILCWRRFGPLPTLTVVSALSLLAVTGLRKSWLAGLHPQYLALFTLGMFGATLAYSANGRWQRLRERIPWKTVILFLLIVLVLIGAFFVYTHAFRAVQYLDYLVGALSMSVLVAASRGEQSRMHCLLSWRPLVCIGGFSYSLYLIHAPLIQLIWQYLLHPLHLPAAVTCFLLLLFGTPLIIGAAYLFYLVGECPFLNTRHDTRLTSERISTPRVKLVG